MSAKTAVRTREKWVDDTLLFHPTAPYWYLYALFFIFLVTPTFSTIKLAAVGLVVAVLTFHRADSYGAHLQAYATVAFLNQSGYDAELVDYTNKYEQRFQKLFYSENGRMSGFLTSFIKDFVFRKRYYKSKAFGSIEQYCSVSKRKYTSVFQYVGGMPYESN